MKKNFLLVPFVIIILVLLGIGLFDLNKTKSQTSSSGREITDSQNGQTIESPSSIKNISQITLEITSPKNNSTVKNGTVTVSGKTLSNADVFVNDKELKADAFGNFSTSVQLDEGQNTIVVAANDPQGNISEREINVTFDPNTP